MMAISPISLNWKESDAIVVFRIIYQIMNLSFFIFLFFKTVVLSYGSGTDRPIPKNAITAIYSIGLVILLFNFCVTKFITSMGGNKHKDFFYGLSKVDRQIYEAFNVEINFAKIEKDFWKWIAILNAYFLFICLPIYMIVFGGGIGVLMLFWFVV